MYTIYRLFLKSTGESYIGCTRNLRRRTNQHKSYAACGDPRPLYEFVREHGWENFKIETLATESEKSKALDLEQYFIREFDSHENGLNFSETGTGRKKPDGFVPWNKGKPILPHVKEAIYKANKGRKASPETRRKISESQRGEKHHFYGKKLSEEHVRKLSESHKGHRHPEEWKENMSKIMTGRKVTWADKISAAHKAKPPVTCPHCGKVGKGSAMKRHHFDNCKMIQEAAP